MQRLITVNKYNKIEKKWQIHSYRCYKCGISLKILAGVLRHIEKCDNYPKSTVPEHVYLEDGTEWKQYVDITSTLI